MNVVMSITLYREGQHTSTLDDPTIVDIAETHAKRPPQKRSAEPLPSGALPCVA